ncbi:MAG: beta-galactosidase [Anaerolineae bacterium]|nr:beta-galactosidase [Anaerolineae bacterium]
MSISEKSVSEKFGRVYHGSDYNPEQWPCAVWPEDFRLMQEAGISAVAVGVFSWVSLQPAEDKFTFDWLDEIMDGLATHGIKAMLATPSAAQPAWMSQHYPTILRSDEQGIRRQRGGRTNYCPNSPDYRRLSGNMARALAERYKDHPALLLWHISNEYAGTCTCETCAARFREWLQRNYGTLDAMNARWWTPFWSHTFTDWSQVMPPLSNGEMHMHGLNVDYFRFMTESQLACYTNERDIIRAITPDVPITTNLMGTYKPLDYRQWAKEMDIITWDCYPSPGQSAGEIAFQHDLHRGLKDGQSFLLMEQTPSSQNWQPVNALKRPGVLRLWSYLAMAHGADSISYFQWRRGRGGSEKLHGAVIEHSGRSDTRVFREVSQIGAELKALGDVVLGARGDAKVGLLFDWDNWHALDDAIGPVRNKRYVDTIRKHYLAFYRQNIPVDIVFPDSDFSRYDILVAPMLYMVKQGVAERIEAMVRKGGTFVTTYFSGIVDETDLAFENGYPGPLHNVLGIHVEEIDAMYENQSNSMVMSDGSGSYACNHLADLLHTESAHVLATYGSDFYQGMPALTKNAFGQGHAYYLASDPDPALLDTLYAGMLNEHRIEPPMHTPPGVEVTVRRKGEQALLFMLNHNAEAVTLHLGAHTYRDLLTNATLQGQIEVAGYGVHILVAHA